MPQKNSEKFEQLGTKIDPAMAEVLNAVCDALEVDVYHLLQWFAYTVIKAASPMHRLDPRVQKLMAMLESDAGWQKAFNLANPNGLKVAQCILILEQDKHDGFGAVMVDKPFMGDARQTECVDDILERVFEVTMRGIYRRFRLLGGSMGCDDLKDVLITMLERQATIEMDDKFQGEMPQHGDRATNGKVMAYGKRTRRKKHFTPDTAPHSQRIQFDDTDHPDNDNDTARDLEEETGIRPFGSEW